MDLISVIIPVYNAKKLLPECIKSVLAQTYHNLEIILIDDGSSDGSGPLCDEYSAKDSRIIVIHQQNEGVASARNKGLEIASGDYISFIDNDDFIHPEFYELLLRAIKESDYQLSMSLYKNTYDIEPSYQSPSYNTVEVAHDKLRTMLFNVDASDIPYGYIWAKLYARDLLNGIQFKEIEGEDVDFCFNVGRKINKAIVVQEHLYFWYQHNLSQRRNRAADKLATSLSCYYNILRAIPSEEKYERAHCLKRLYITMLNIRYTAKKYERYKPQKKELAMRVKSVFAETKEEFLRNKHISLLYKLGLLTFYQIPFTYNFFRWIMASAVKTKNFFLRLIKG